jgi:hypothetical protein
MSYKRLTETQKGQMARRLVYYCIGVLSVAAVWAMILKTISVITGNPVDLTDVLVFIAAAFGGELLMLLIKRIFSKPTTKTEEESL